MLGVVRAFGVLGDIDVGTFRFQDVDDIDRSLVTFAPVVSDGLGVDVDRFRVAALVVEEPFAVRPVRGAGDVVDDLAVQCGADADPRDRYELAELLWSAFG
jgi:hypothetical protein